MTAKSTTYWVTTGILAFVLLSGGAAQLLRVQDTVDGIVHLGYPLYVVTILGIWKLLGGIVILVPGTPRLKEWAYAGAVFDLTGAVVSHAAAGDRIVHLIGPLAFTIVAMVSWALRPQGRMVGNVLASRRPWSA